jgi:hypothetical protein
VSGTIVYLDLCALKRPFDDDRTALKRRDQMRVDVVRPEQIAFDEETAE